MPTTNTSLADGIGSDDSYPADFPHIAPPNNVSPGLPPLVPREAG